MDEARRKKEREARAWFGGGDGSGLTAAEVFHDNLRTGKWLLLHPMVAQRTYDVGVCLGGYLGYGEEYDTGVKDEAGIMFSAYSHNPERTDLGGSVSLGLIEKKH